MNDAKPTIAVAKGDGIGPEIMDAVIHIFDAAGVPLQYEYIEMGKSIFDKGESTGMTDKAKATIEETGILFKGPMETPKGKGVKSINVTARKTWNTYANVRKFRNFKGVKTVFSEAGIPVNLTVLRENIEDTYGGIEYLHNYDVSVCYRIITRPGSEQFIRYAFEFARQQGIKKITCGHKANIMKLTDGMFMNAFYEIAKEYPEFEIEDMIVDALAMKMVQRPQQFELIVLTNLQGDILSDLAAGLVGGLGFAPSANVGDNISIFEAVHGTAPDIAGRGIANPTSLLLSGLMMLRHLGLNGDADKIENSLLYTLEQGKHTGDFGDKSTPALGTMEFAQAIIDNLGQLPEEDEPIRTGENNLRYQKPTKPAHIRIMEGEAHPEEEVMGFDCYIDTAELPDKVANKILPLLPEKLRLVLISNRGTVVWPEASVYTDSVAGHRLRIELNGNNGASLTREEIFDCCKQISTHYGIDDVEVLKRWGDLNSFTLAQGQECN